jgi:hypothetical protein
MATRKRDTGTFSKHAAPYEILKAFIPEIKSTKEVRRYLPSTSTPQLVKSLTEKDNHNQTSDNPPMPR